MDGKNQQKKKGRRAGDRDVRAKKSINATVFDEQKDFFYTFRNLDFILIFCNSYKIVEIQNLIRF